MDQTLMLAAVPVAGIGLALAFEGGYASRFGVPVWLIELDSPQIVLASALVASSAMLVVNLLPFIPERPWTTLLWLLLRSTPLAWLVGYVVSETEWVWGVHLIFPLAVVALMGPVALIMVLDDLILPIWRKTGATIWDRWEAELTLVRQQPVVRHSVAHRMWRHTGPSGPLSIGIVALMGVAVWTLGERRAERQTDFLFVASESCFAIRRYHDHILCVDADTAARVVHPHFKLLPIGEPSIKMSALTLYGVRTVADSTSRIKAFRRSY